jgi:hypothetical protein
LINRYFDVGQTWPGSATSYSGEKKTRNYPTAADAGTMVCVCRGSGWSAMATASEISVT